MKRRLPLALLAAMAIAPWPATAMHWVPVPGKPGPGMHDRSAAKAFLLIDGEGADASLIDPRRSLKPLPLNQGAVAVHSTGMDNYHALVARRDNLDGETIAVRYVYMHGKPSGESPAALMAFEKGRLEIEPAPYAREHWHYQAGSHMDFLVRFEGRPLPGAQLWLITSNGTGMELMADDEGRVRAVLPDDFAETRPGRRDNRPAEMVLSVSHREGGGNTRQP